MLRHAYANECKFVSGGKQRAVFKNRPSEFFRNSDGSYYRRIDYEQAMPQPRKMELRLLLLLECSLLVAAPSQSAEVSCGHIVLKVLFKIVWTAGKRDYFSKYEVINVNPIDKIIEEWYSNADHLRKESVKISDLCADTAHLM